MTIEQDSDELTELAPEQEPSPDPTTSLGRLRARELGRTGPGTAARRTLEALADIRRLSDDLADFDDYEI